MAASGSTVMIGGICGGGRPGLEGSDWRGRVADGFTAAAARGREGGDRRRHAVWSSRVEETGTRAAGVVATGVCGVGMGGG